MLPGPVALCYRERLARLGLYSLEGRRMRGALIEVYKIMRGIDRMNTHSLFPRVGELKTRVKGLRREEKDLKRT